MSKDAYYYVSVKRAKHADTIRIWKQEHELYYDFIHNTCRILLVCV